MKLLGIISVSFLRNRSTAHTHLYIRQILEKEWDCNEIVHQVFIDFKKTNDSVRREEVYNILLEFGVPRELVRMIEVCVNETYET
jgi:hypothetical protein